MNSNTVTVDIDGEDFQMSGMNFRFYNGKLWADGGDNDDVLIRSIDLNDASDEIEIEITDSDIEKYKFALANGLNE